MLNETTLGMAAFEDHSPHTWSTEANASGDVLLGSISTETDLLSHHGDAADLPEVGPYTVESPEHEKHAVPVDGDNTLSASHNRQPDIPFGSYDVDQL